MIRTRCSCGAKFTVPESMCNESILCDNCNRHIHPISAEKLTGEAGEGDFDASLIVTEGPEKLGDYFFLGGGHDIEIGIGKNISVTGKHVSALHARMKRIDFGPSRWAIEDANSHLGVFVNGQKVR